MNNDDNLDLLDLNDDADSIDALPDAAPLSGPRPKKPWLLMGVGLLIIILAIYIIIRVVDGDSASTMEVNLDAPAVVIEGAENVPQVGPGAVPVSGSAQPVDIKPDQQPGSPVVQPTPQVQPEPIVQNATPGVPVRVIDDRNDVTFNPDKPVQKQEVKPVINKKTVKSATKQPERRVQTQQRAQTTPKAFAWYVQIGSYSSRALAEAGQRKLQASHQNLFSGHQFVILAAVLPNGKTTYRLRVGFNSASEANSFCRNAKADGLDCYVAK